MKMFQSWLFTDFCSTFTWPTLWQTGWRAFHAWCPRAASSPLFYLLYAQMIAKLIATGAALLYLQTIPLLSSDTSLNTVPWRTILGAGVNHPLFFLRSRWLKQKRCALISGNSPMSSLLLWWTTNYALSPRLLLCFNVNTILILFLLYGICSCFLLYLSAWVTSC